MIPNYCLSWMVWVCGIHFHPCSHDVSLQEIKAEIVLWTAGFVLMTLIINASILPWLLRVTGLTKGASMLLSAIESRQSACTVVHVLAC